MAAIGCRLPKIGGQAIFALACVFLIGTESRSQYSERQFSQLAVVSVSPFRQ